MRHKEEKMEKSLDKMFLLTYTAEGQDGFRHACHAWLRTEEELKAFVQEEKENGSKPEVDLAIEILEYRPILL